MQALVFGDLHGQIKSMYAQAEAWSREKERPVEVLLQVGDFGIYPVPAHMPEEKQVKYGLGDYGVIIAEGAPVPIPTYFCKGNNEDFEALEAPLLPGLHYMPDGTVKTFGNTRVAFTGGAWSRKSYESDTPKPQHISRAGVERLYEQEWDVLITHESPSGLRLPGRYYTVGAPPLRTLIEDKQPRLVIHGHHHIAGERMIGSTRVISLCRLSAKRLTECILPLEL